MCGTPEEIGSAGSPTKSASLGTGGKNASISTQANTTTYPQGIDALASTKSVIAIHVLHSCYCCAPRGRRTVVKRDEPLD